MGRHHRGADGNRRHLGMNVDAMPELRWRFGYLFGLATMVGACGAIECKSLATKGD
jgi:hypothetical protein